MAQQIKDLQADNADLRAELQEIKLALQKLTLVYKTCCE